MQDNSKKEAYKYLNAPLPLQQRQPVLVKSLLDFVLQQPGELKEIVKDYEQLGKVEDWSLVNRRNIHQIGDSLVQLFKRPIYKSYDGLIVGDNEHFGSCRTDNQYKINAVHTPIMLQDNVLQFQSRFESGNLAVATCLNVNERVYYLALQRDYNTESITTQWFYFKVKNKQNIGNFSFQIVNYVKPYSMFKAGMKPCIFSTKQNNGWKRDGHNIDYRKNSIPINETSNYYTLSFSYEFSQPNDQVFIAYCYPYTYSRLLKFLDSAEQRNSDKMRRKIVTKTLGDNIVELISITNPQYSNKKLLFFTARVHPGQTISSYTCQSLISFLLSNHPDAQKLRNQFIIKIIPMLNPDGVVNGNYRTSLSGEDLNRQWKFCNKSDHPEIYFSKKIILQSQYKKLLYIDLHGHSKKKATFMYGCVSQKTPYIPKQLPYVLSKKLSHFSYFTCNFSIPKSKEGTSRITLWKCGFDYSYTYQLSFCGPQRERRHFNIKDYETIGIELCKNLSIYFYSRILQLTINEEVNKHCQQFYDNDEIMNMGNQETNGSSSELEDEATPQQIRERQILKKNRTHNATQKSESNRISGVIDTFLIKQMSQRKPTIQNYYDQSKQLLLEKKKQSEKQIYFRQRQSFMATKVNIQQMTPQNQIYSSMSTHYGFAIQKTPAFLQQIRSSSLRNNGESQSDRKSQKKQISSGGTFGVLLPNVQKNNYKRYQRYKKDRPQLLGERSISVYAPNTTAHSNNELSAVFQSKMMTSNFLGSMSRQISLIQRIRSRNDRGGNTKF